MRASVLTATAAVIFTSILAAPAFSQNPNAAQTPPRPAPRLADGHVNLGPLPGQPGLWNPQGGAQLARPDTDTDFGLFQASAAEPTDPFLRAKPKLSQIPFQPWARALFDARVLSRLEPYTRCKPSAGARLVATAYGTQLLNFSELDRFYTFQTGGAHSFRTVYLDGRPHPANVSPSYFGHAIGRWEGDTLVVDSVGFNEGMWIDNLGMPHTEKLHLIEKFTRINFETIKYEVTIDDPGAYTATWNSGFYLRWSPGAESFEFICQDNNQAHELMVGSGTSVDRSLLYIP